MPYPTDNPYAQDMGLGAYFGGAQLADNNQAQGLDLQRAGLANMFQDLQNQRYQQVTPYEVAQQAGLAERQPLLTQQQALQNQQLGLQNQFTQATQPGKIQSTNQENQTKYSSDYLKEQVSRTDNLISAYNNGGAPSFIQAAQDLKVPQDRIMSMLTSGDVLGQLQQHRERTVNMLAETPEMIQKERESAQKHLEALQLAKENNAAALERTQIMANSRIGAAEARANSKGLKPDELFANMVQEKLDNGEIDQQQAMELIARMRAASAQQQPALVNGQIGTQGQTGNIMPNIGNKQNSGHALVDVQKMYPGVPVEKLKEAYKKKFGVDLQ